MVSEFQRSARVLTGKEPNPPQVTGIVEPHRDRERAQLAVVRAFGNPYGLVGLRCDPMQIDRRSEVATLGAPNRFGPGNSWAVCTGEEVREPQGIRLTRDFVMDELV